MTHSDISPFSRARGCLLGGAIGDALGAAVEFMSLANIRHQFGVAGIRDFAPVYGRLGAITDDTQMTLFTAEGVIRAYIRGRDRGICHAPSVIHHALLRWLVTQGAQTPATVRLLGSGTDGGLSQRREMYAQRAPGRTCLSALQASSRFGQAAENDSKGCGAIMRIAPIGLFSDSGADALAATYAVACESAKSTHGHPSSTFASGFFALTIARLMHGASLPEAIAHSKEPLLGETDAAEVLAAIDLALALAASDLPATPELVERLGAGWVAEEALAIALFCVLRAESFAHGVQLAVNHSGDSDSTGSLAGQLLGTASGIGCVPPEWLAQVELRDVIEELAADLVAVVGGGLVDEARRYPGR